MFFAGFFFLIKGADLLVDGASSIARRLGISTLIIGLTVVAFGTSTPELIVNILASVSGNNELAIGNILGSNISNVFLILGIAAIIFPLRVQEGTAWKEIPLNLLGILAVGALVNDTLIDYAPDSVLSRIDGIILLCFFCIYIYYAFWASKVNGHLFSIGSAKGEKVPVFKTTHSVLMAAIGILGLTLGGKFIVDGGTAIARTLGLSQALIGLTLVAIGTSLPELATTVVAAYKKNTDIAIGNIVGSNLFNLFWILGLTSIIHPIRFNRILNTDLNVVILSTILLFGFLFIGKRHILERWQGGLFVSIYVVYIIFITLRG